VKEEMKKKNLREEENRDTRRVRREVKKHEDEE